MPKLTKRQTEVFQLIQDRMNATGAPPTRAEIAQEMGFRSPNAAEDHLRALARKGVIELVPGTSRGIRLLRESGLPIVGHVAAGQPMLAEENIQSNYKINKDVFAPHADYLLKVCGDSMKDAGILNGDLLAVHAASEAQSGQIIVARIGNDITVKRFYRDAVNDHLVSLKPENDAHAPIELNIRQQPLIIEGVGVGVIRQYSDAKPAQPAAPVPQQLNNSTLPNNPSYP